MFHEPTLNNPHYNDCYFAYDEGLAESLYVFVDGNDMTERFRTSNTMTIAETGFGTGLNLLAMIRALRDAEIEERTIVFHSVERFPLTVQRIEELTERFREEIEPELSIFLTSWEKCYDKLSYGWNKLTFNVDSITVELNLFHGDVLPFMNDLPSTPDAWFLDGHSPDKNPDMWNETIMGLVGKNSGPHSTLATFTAAGIVKEGLRKGGFFIKRRKGFGGKRHMITGKIEETSPDSE